VATKEPLSATEFDCYYERLTPDSTVEALETMMIRLSFLFSILFCVCAFAQETYTEREVTIWSEGTRLAGNVHTPAGLEADDKVPAIILCHGWGGTKAHLNQTTAPKLAEAGFLVVTFDYRGWGDSDPKVILKEDVPETEPGETVRMKVQPVREVVAPYDQATDIINVISFIEGEPHVDADRIGLWGSSFGGGLVIYVAAHDDRVAAVFAQAAAMDARIGLEELPGGLEMVKRERIERARGELQPVPQGRHTFPNLRGTPHLDKFLTFRPIEYADDVQVPTMIVDAEHEELFDIADHGEKMFNALPDTIDKKYEVIEGITHYGVYTEAFPEATRMAIDWFNEHLK